MRINRDEPVKFGGEQLGKLARSECFAVVEPASSDLRELLSLENTAPQAPTITPRAAPPPKWNVFERAAYDRETQILAENEGSSI